VQAANVQWHGSVVLAPGFSLDAARNAVAACADLLAGEPRSGGNREGAETPGRHGEPGAPEGDASPSEQQGGKGIWREH